MSFELTYSIFFLIKCDTTKYERKMNGCFYLLSFHPHTMLYIFWKIIFFFHFWLATKCDMFEESQFSLNSQFIGYKNFSGYKFLIQLHCCVLCQRMEREEKLNMDGYNQDKKRYLNCIRYTI